MRSFLLCLLASPAAAWDFTPGDICLLGDVQGGLSIELTHDPSQPLYSITLRRDTPWPEAPVFGIAFANGPTITTNRHVLSEGGQALTVTDRGFGNVIDGLAAGGTALALVGDDVEEFSLEGAAEPAEAFAACKPFVAA
ncbi:MAG: hypothetical protein AAF618_00945 [Pseudomonadota bacterium]